MALTPGSGGGGSSNRSSGAYQARQQEAQRRQQEIQQRQQMAEQQAQAARAAEMLKQQQAQQQARSYSGTTNIINQAAPEVAPAPAVVEPPRPVAPSFKDWLNQDMTTAAQKSSVDANLQDQLAGMLADRNKYERQNTEDLGQINKAAPQAFEDVAGDFAGRGLLQSSLYDQADDQAFEAVETQRNGLRNALSDYMTNYGQSVTQRQNAATAEKRNLEAQALNRYTQQFAGFDGVTAG